MGGSIGGHRHGTGNVDPDDPRRKLGDRIRQLRIDAGLHLADVVDAMRTAGHASWTKETLSVIQTGRGRQLYAIEALSLSRLLGVSVDKLLVGAVGEPNIPRRRRRSRP